MKTDHVTPLWPVFVVLWLRCDVLRLILLLNWVLFCITHFHIKRNRVVLCFGVCSAPSCDTSLLLTNKHIDINTANHSGQRHFAISS